MICLNKYSIFLLLISIILVGNNLVLSVISINICNSTPNTIFQQKSDNSVNVGQIEVNRNTEATKSIETKITRINRPNPSFGGELYLLEKQNATVHAVAFSPDGKLLASGDDAGVIKLWDMTDFSPLKEIQTFQGHSERIEILAFSPDGAVLASGSYDNYIKLWNVTELQNLGGTVPESKKLSEHAASVMAIDFSPDGKVLVSGDEYGNLKIWNVTNLNQSIRTFKIFNVYTTCLQFSADGMLIAACSWDGTIKIWNTTSLLNGYDNEYDEFFGHSDWVNEIKFSPDGKMLVSASEDHIFWLWDVASHKKIDEFKGHNHISPNFFCYVDFSPSGSMVATGGADSAIRLWDVTSRKLIQILPQHNDRIRRVVFSPDGTMLVSSSYDNTIKLWNTVRGAEFNTLLGHKGAVNSIKFSPNGTLLASGSDDNTIKLWDVETGTNLETLRNHSNSVTSVAFSPNDTILASGSMDSTIKLWNTTNKQWIQDLPGHKDFVYSVAFSPSGTLLASGGRESNVILWDVNGTILHNCYNHFAAVNSVVFSYDGTVVASGSEDKNIVIWDVTSGNVKKILTGHKGAVTSVAFSPTSLVLASSSEDTTVKLWNVTNGVELELQSSLFGHTEAVWSVAFSPDGKLLASGGLDAIRIWDVTTGKEIKTFFSNWAKITSVTFSPEGKLLASVDTLSSVKLWNVTAIPDFDKDGMQDAWELQFRPTLDPSDYWDKFDDEDNDGLMNSLEHFLGTYPNDADSDNDNIPDGWEFLGGLKPTVNDANDDSDDDGMNNLFEYQNGLNPRINDAAEDKDNDTLTNYQECQLGLNATNSDSDYDGMPDDWEVDNRLDPTKNDADDDPDGDWVSNLDEYIGQSNPRKFWSVPLFAFSARLLIMVTVFIITTLIGVVIFFNYRNKQRKAFITSLSAPNYATALLVERAGYENYPAFVQAVSEAKTLGKQGMKAYYQGDPAKAIQQLEKSLTTFQRTRNDSLIAQTIFLVAQIQKERQELTSDSSILKIFPRRPFSNQAVEAIDNMLKALLAEAERNWGLANSAWQAALTYEELSNDLQVICQGALVGSDTRSWLENPSETSREMLKVQLDKWQKACQMNKQYAGVCQAFLLRARVAFASAQFDEVEKSLKQCSDIAETNKLSIFQEAALKEKTILLRHKKRIEEEMAKPLSPEEQSQVMQEYIKEALESLREERLI